jgi:hypothetical protein
MPPQTSERVPAHTRESINERLQRAADKRVNALAHAPAGALEQRLRELDAEWDIERTLEANAAMASLLGLALALWVDPRWALLSTAVALFLLQHAIQGWCPPLPVFRRLGKRTIREIDQERFALKALRGDFDDLPAADAVDGAKSVRRILKAMRR